MRAIFNVISNICAFPFMISRNVCYEKGLFRCLVGVVIYIPVTVGMVLFGCWHVTEPLVEISQTLRLCLHGNDLNRKCKSGVAFSLFIPRLDKCFFWGGMHAYASLWHKCVRNVSRSRECKTLSKWKAHPIKYFVVFARKRCRVNVA